MGPSRLAGAPVRAPPRPSPAEPHGELLRLCAAERLRRRPVHRLRLRHVDEAGPREPTEAARRPLALASLPALKRDFGVTSVEVVLGTRPYRDDHIAGLNLLRDVEGTEVWLLPKNVAPILVAGPGAHRPARRQWFEPPRIPA
ncbi:hypothetical protein ACRAWD_21925 [Caulobacter segnis]